ncbi:MAG: hypothetical protein QOK00_712 [Thermoleophilaceae bacterium]|nr:hypothetical protein [Thermoleophilaceae bacterium]
MIERLQRELTDPRTYGRIGYMLIAGVLGSIEFVFLVTTISLGVGLAVTLIGIPILIAAVYAWGWLAELERRAIQALTGTRIPNPYRPVPEGGGRWARLRARLADPATWKDLAFLALQFPFGLASSIVALTVLGVGIQTLTAPLWYWALPDGLGILRIDTLWEALALVPLGVVLLALGIPALSALGRLYISYAEVLLGSNVDPAVTAQMTDLRDARSRIIEAADAERRRIERDLHDGAQQQLIALTIDLRRARDVLADNPQVAAERLDRAAEAAAAAISELADLAHGIYPPVLRDSGLIAALRVVVRRHRSPVELEAERFARLPAAVEAAVYFAVLEGMQNAAKHAPDAHVTVRISQPDGQVEFEIADDGPGFVIGANHRGQGMLNISDRVGALGGTVVWDSAPGAGTCVRGAVPVA